MIQICNVTREDDPRVDALRRAIDGQTYLNLRVICCPVGGSLDVCVESTRPYAGTAEEVQGLVNMCLVEALAAK